jgi:hypothetical protein
MSFSFLPSYLQIWIEAERNCKEQEYDLHENIDQEYDWVVVDNRNEAAKWNDLLQDYVVIKGRENAQKENDAWIDVGKETKVNSERSRKASRRARKRAKRSADR